MKMIGSREEDLAFVYLELPRLIFDAGLGARDSGTRRHVTIIGPIENQNVLGIRYCQHVVRRIDAETDDVPELGFWTMQKSRGRDISVGGGRENIYGLSSQAGDQDH